MPLPSDGRRIASLLKEELTRPDVPEVPLVTVAMPVFNAGSYLRPAVMSIVVQTFRNWELLVIDDGSSDGAVDSIADIGDRRIFILRDGLNKGLAARLNEAIDRARGRYLARMDQDDIAYPERFARQLESFMQDQSLDLVATRCIAIDLDNAPIGMLPSAINHEELCAKPWLGFYMPHPTWMGRIEWFRHHRYARPGPYFCEDQELLLRTFSTSRYATVAEVLFAYRIRPRIGLHKSFRTRLTLFGLQARRFLQYKRPDRVVLSFVVFILRCMADLLRFARQTIGIGTSAIAPVGEIERIRWDSVLNVVIPSKLPLCR